MNHSICWTLTSPKSFSNIHPKTMFNTRSWCSNILVGCMTKYDDFSFRIVSFHSWVLTLYRRLEGLFPLLSFICLVAVSCLECYPPYYNTRLNIKQTTDMVFSINKPGKSSADTHFSKHSERETSLTSCICHSRDCNSICSCSNVETIRFVILR
jgi:hypothetical protein